MWIPWTFVERVFFNFYRLFSVIPHSFIDIPCSISCKILGSFGFPLYKSWSMGFLSGIPKGILKSIYKWDFYKTFYRLFQIVVYKACRGCIREKDIFSAAFYRYLYSIPKGILYKVFCRVYIWKKFYKVFYGLESSPWGIHKVYRINSI